MTLGVGVQGMPTINFSSFFLTTMTAGPAMMGQSLSVGIAGRGLVIGSQEVLYRSAPSQANNPSEIDDLNLECEQRSRISIRSSSNHFMPTQPDEPSLVEAISCDINSSVIHIAQHFEHLLS